MFYVWGIPLLVLIAVLVWMFFAMRRAGSGIRRSGNTVHDDEQGK
jgi:hypothetical protein